MGKLELIIETGAVSIYSPKYDGEELTEFEKFLEANHQHRDPQLKAFYDAILSLIEKIEESGAKINRFRPEGGCLQALPDYITFPGIRKSIGKMRLYCLRFSDRLLVIGNGGVTKTQKWQDDPSTLTFVKELKSIEKQIKRNTRRNGIDFDDLKSMKTILSTITLTRHEKESSI